MTSPYLSSPPPLPATSATPASLAQPVSSPNLLHALLRERSTINPFRTAVPNLWHLLELEIARLTPQTKSSAPTLTRRASAPLPRKRLKIPVPADKFPEYNFVGRLLGPRGGTLKTLERQTACKIMIRGKGSIRKDKEPDVRGKPGWEHVFNEPLHVVIEVPDALDDHAAARALQHAKDAVEQLLVPVPEERDPLKRQQLRALAIMNGTYRGAPAKATDHVPISTFSPPPPQPPMASSPHLSSLMSFEPPSSPHMSLYRSMSYPRAMASSPESPSSGSTTPNNIACANMYELASGPVDRFTSSTVEEDSAHSSPQSDREAKETEIALSASFKNVKLSSAETSFGYGGFIAQEFYNGAFSNGASATSPWDNTRDTDVVGGEPGKLHKQPSAPASFGSLYGLSPIPSPHVLTTSTSTVTPLDRRAY